ncbi:MAG: hypothetical protein C5B60_02555 [Chloroflexi bacterium]|nr:MAG: hypothetical protein C5B60_02555 [Chloroflexota bacterium]
MTTRHDRLDDLPRPDGGRHQGPVCPAPAGYRHRAVRNGDRYGCAGGGGASLVDALVSIITPTWRADPTKLRRCLNSVARQTYANFEQIVASDGKHELLTWGIVQRFEDRRIRYYVTETRHGGFGAGVRQEVMTECATGKYLVFLDDDNIIFPTYLEKMLKALLAQPQAKFAICEELHFGPLQEFHGDPPVVLLGVPVLYHIDTLQIMIEAAAMQEVGWVSNSYFADGETFGELARRYQYVNVRECLCAHL